MHTKIWMLLTVLCATGVLTDERSDWAEGDAQPTGATRDYYNRAALLSWDHFMGDWRDARDQPQGAQAYAETLVADQDTARFIEWDVTSLVQQWQDGAHPNQGFFLRIAEGGGKAVFASREHNTSDQRPMLVLESPTGTQQLVATADTFLSKSTYRSQGASETLHVARDAAHLLIRFDPRQFPTKRVQRARLRLFTTAQYGDAKVGVFRCRQGHDAPAADPQLGLAAKYPGDRNIESDPAVWMACDFESAQWRDQWSHTGDMDVIGVIQNDAAHKFEALAGQALRVKIARGRTSALNTLYRFQRKTGSEPEEVYFRYYLRLASDWNQTIQGGKMPGISGTYGVAGWGGRKSDGTDGWSARGLFRQTVPPGNPLAGTTPIGTYCYHADMPDRYGDNWIWQTGYRGYLERNRWYCVEQYLKLNQPGKKNGVLKAWIDGRPAFEKSDIRFRHVDKLKIEQIWMNVYHGGTRPSPHDQHLFIDHVVIAKQYIGPRVDR